MASMPVEKYHLPKLEALGWEIVNPEIYATPLAVPTIMPYTNQVEQLILCTVNVQHNCAANHCDESAMVAVYQEQEAISTGTRPAVNHNSEDDIMLNTMQMRDAIYLQQLGLISPLIQCDTAIQQGAVAEIEAQQSSKVQTKACARQGRAPLLVTLAKSLLKKPIAPSANPQS